MLTLRPRLRTTSLSTQPSPIQWSFQELIDWRYLPHIRPIKGDIPLKYGLKYGTVPPFSDPGIPIEKLGSLLRRRLVHWDDAAQKSGLSV